jgi:polyisoprenyl-teichoic acid--peptidoglycan teichoic acid transferase
MSFQKKKVGAVSTPINRKKYLNPTSMLFASSLLVAVVLILLIAKQVAGFTTTTLNRFTDSTIKLVSQQIGTPMQRDQYGHINILIAGYAGSDYRGGRLTDTLMLASFNPELGTVTFISIPRDLYVRFWRGATSRINSLYWAMYLEWNNDHELGVSALLEKVGEITGVPVNYYAMVDFDWFVEFIDELWGIEIDVKEPLYDDQYPWPNDSYTIFQVSAGTQYFDGETALKFARSRKSTSDFSRSFRQQQIIAGVVDKIKGSISLTNMGELKALYTKGMSIFETNIGLENMLWLSQFGEKKPQFFSYVFESDCSITTFSITKPWCVLQYGNRAAFGGQSVVIPYGASANNLSYYVKTQDVAHRLVYRQDVLLEQAPIVIQNGIDKELARAQGYKITWVADEIAIELSLRWFQVQDIDNAETSLEQTTLYVDNQAVYVETIDALAAFVPYTNIIESPQYGSGVTIILGNDWLKRM